MKPATGKGFPGCEILIPNCEAFDKKRPGLYIVPVS